MMRVARTASLLVAFYLLASAATASAECAWVMWIYTEKVTSSLGMTKEHEATGGWSTRADCEAKRNEAIMTVAQIPPKGLLPGQEITRHGDVVTVVTPRPEALASVVTFTWSCLPDTVDPRGPKGK